MRQLQKILSVICLGYVCASAYGAVIHGTVTDSDGVVLADTSVTLFTDAERRVEEKWTAPDGTFSFDVPDAEMTYRVEARPLFHALTDTMVYTSEGLATQEVTLVCGVGYGNLYGSVRREDRMTGRLPLRVRFAGPDSGECTVDGHGNFSAEGILAGYYTLYITARGFYPIAASNIAVYATRPTTNTFEVTRIDFEELDRKIREASEAEDAREFARAIRLYDDILRVHPGSRPYGNRAFLHLHAEQYNQAIADFREGLNWEPDSDWLLMGLGEALEFAEKFDEAIGVYTDVLTRNVEDANVYRRRARARMGAGDTNGVMEDLSLMLERSSDTAEAHYQRAQIQYRLGMLEEAMEEVAQAIRLKPDETDYRYFQAQIIYFTGTDDEGLAAVEEVLRHAPNHTQSLLLLGVLHTHKQNWIEAERAYTRVISQSPYEIQALTGRGNARLKLKQYDEAYADFSRAVTLHPSHITALMGQANVLIETQKFEDALAILNRVLELEPHDDIALYNRAQVYTALGMDALAEEDLRRRTLLLHRGARGVATEDER